jgi:hypothetical protein|tara:strand:+ start:4053 stop:4172 length:120 start_codon:yes stop_codon:yes gene_type:complete
MNEEKIKTLCIMIGVSIMHDVRMIVREELARVGLKEEEE